MTISIKHEMIVFWTFVLCGQTLGIFFDFFRSLRKNIPHNKIFVAAEDIVFCTVAFKTFFDICYATNNGGLRWYIFAAFICSSIIYFCLASKYVFAIWNFFVKFALKIFSPVKNFTNFFTGILRSGLKSLKLYIFRFFSCFKFKKAHKVSKNSVFTRFFSKKPLHFKKNSL